MIKIPLGQGGTSKSIQYYSYTCKKCGVDAKNTYCEPSRTQMYDNHLCWDCNFWEQFKINNQQYSSRMTIINGHRYTPGNRTTGEFRGMAGRRFDIEYIEPSIFAGQKITTFDLWSGSTLPNELKELFPDTAQFLGAEKTQAGEITCWNPSDDKNEPYQLPCKLKGLK